MTSASGTSVSGIVRRVVVPSATIIGWTLVLVAAAWWWVVFHQVVLAGYLTVPRALPCLVSGSIRCTLAQALCNGEHFLGIRRYDATTFWVGLGIAAVAVLPSQLVSIVRQPRRMV